MDASERFEIMASVFRSMTGLMAPGKSAPIGYYTEDREAMRMPAWEAWTAQYGNAVRLAIVETERAIAPQGE